MRISITADSGTEAVDLLLDCDDATPAAELVKAVAREVGVTPAPAISSSVGLAEFGVVNGARLRASDLAATTPALATSGLQLHVVGGPEAGLVFDLPIGSYDLGRSGDIAWSDNSLSRRHVRVEVSSHEVLITDLESSNGTRLDAEPCAPKQPVGWTPGQLLEIGDSQVVLRPARGRGATVEAAEPGWLNFMRPPRIRPRRAAPSVSVPIAPKAKDRRRFPAIAMVIPVLFGIVMALVLGRPQYLLFTLMSPMMLVSNFVADRRTDAKDHKQAVLDYTVALAAAQSQLRKAVADEERRLRDEQPDPAAVLMTATLPGARLWERRRHDSDFLHVRVGTADQPSTVKLSGATDIAEHRLKSVPVGFDLAVAGVAAIAGPEEDVDAALRWIVGQLAVQHSPRDLDLTFVSAPGSSEWNWLRWLPHLRPDDPDSCVAMVGNDPDTVAAQVAALSAMVRERKSAVATGSGLRAASFTAHVVLVRGYRQLRSVLGLGAVLDDGPAVGVYAVCTGDSEQSLPETATAVLSFDPANTSYARLRQRGADDVDRLLVDKVSTGWADRVARGISALHDVGASEQGESLPDSARLLDVLRLDPPEPEAIRARWLIEPRSTQMTIGVGMQGPFSLDLRSDGPHGLIAGMTGSGKTELLQTVIASLAIANRPDWLNFVLIDYKGDSAFKDCVHLPHTVGKVNDLDSFLVQRALASLQAELDVRKNILAEAAVKDIDDYHDLHASEPHRQPLPRLVLVIDEFAEMAKDLPDFMDGLVSIAQVGRSLGVHLLLATQRPSGVVSPSIRANTNLRISLRVGDTADSIDVLASPEAAKIPKSAPGRGYARLGAGSLLPFQAGRVGGRRPGAVSTDLPAPFVASVAWPAVGYATPQRPQGKQTEPSVSDTDLAALVTAIGAAARAEGIPAQRQPWLEPLPAKAVWSSYLDPLAEPERGVVPALPYGYSDLPAQQKQTVRRWDLDNDGHLFVVGSPQSGRSQLLRTLGGAVAALADPSDVHVYAIDCGTGALNPLAALPHCGAVVSRVESERASRLLAKLAAEVDFRQQRLARAGYADIREQRQSDADPLPYLIVMIDRWEGFTSTLAELDGVTDTVLKLLREGAGVGVCLVITGDRSLVNNSRMAAMTENKLCLKLADRSDYGLAGLNARTIPDRLPPGRGYARGGIETQVMLLSEDGSGQGQAIAIQALAQAATKRVESGGRPTRAPFRVDALPVRLGFTEAMAYPASATGPRAVIGVGGDELTAFSPDLGRGTSFIVAGPGRSGRTSVLCGAARSVVMTGGRCVLVAPRGGALQELVGTPGVLALLSGMEPVVELDQWVSTATAESPITVVVDDGEGLRDCPGNEFYLRLARGQIAHVSLVLGGNSEGVAAGLSGWQVEAKKGRQGLLLSPQGLGDGELIGIRLPRPVLGRPVQPGTGWLHLGDGELRQVATIIPA